MPDKNVSSVPEGKGLRFFGIGKVLPFLRVYRRDMLVMVIFGLIGTITDIGMPLLQRYSLNHFIALNTLDTLVPYIIAFILMILLAAISNFISCRLATMIEVRLHRDMRNAAFAHLQELSFSYFSQNSVGYIHARVISDTSKIGTVFSWTLIDATWHISYTIGSIIVMLAINARLALLVMLVLPVIILLYSVFQKKMTELNRSIRETNSKITGNFNEGITGAKTIKSLVIEESISEDFRRDTSEIRKKSVHSARFRGLFAATTTIASSTALAIVLWKGGVIAGSEIGTFSMFMSYAEGLMEPIRWLIDCLSDLITGKVNIERLSRLLETVPDVKDSDEIREKYGDCFEPRRENWEELRGDVEFEDVSFRYPDGDDLVLEHFSLKIPFGTSIAIVGETGAGKSTLANLACRFYEPTEGRVLIDGRDARERSQLWLHSAIGYVLQTPQLFSGTLRDNLLYGNPGATDEQIMDALKLVSAEEIVLRQEKGLDTDVGEGGDLLSTGEKQLISFARALLADPKILVLDEATASVDTITEQKIQSAISKAVEGRTSIVIAHRLSTIKNSDLILVVKDGKIIEQGSHRQLMHQKGYYYSLCTRQYEDEATGTVLDNI